MYASEAKGMAGKQNIYGNGGLSEDQDVNLSMDASWEKTAMHWSIVPWGCRKLLEWIDQRYDHPEIIITENGCAFEDKIVAGKVEDPDRVKFYASYLEQCHAAINNGVNLKGYFAWSFSIILNGPLDTAKDSAFIMLILKPWKEPLNHQPFGMLQPLKRWLLNEN